MNSYNVSSNTLKEIDNILDENKKNEIYVKIKRKLRFLEGLNINFNDVKNFENIKFKYLRHVVNSVHRADAMYEINNNICNIYTSKLDVTNDNICILEAVSIILKYLNELLPEDKRTMNIIFEDIFNEENKTKLEKDIIKLAFYLLIPVDCLNSQEEQLIHMYTLGIEDFSWHRNVLIYDWSKKYNLPESVVDKKLKLIGEKRFYVSSMDDFLLNENSKLYKDDETNDYSKKKVLGDKNE